MTAPLTLDWPNGEITLHPRGAMIRALALKLDDGCWIRPLHRAPWVGTPEGEAQTGLMSGLAGEWPCVPFGTQTRNLPPAWQTDTGWEDPWPHGYAANHDWTLWTDAGALHAAIDLPAEHPVQRLERRIAPVAGGIACALTVLPRKDISLPIGLHPVFRLPADPGTLSLDIAGAGRVFAHPEDPSSDPTPLAPGAVFESLDQVDTADGRAMSLAHLPPNAPCEIRVLVPASGGLVRLGYLDDGVEVRLGYDSDAFPWVMLWISNSGRTGAPWSGRHRAIGVEPVCAPFDLGVSAANGTTPLSAEGRALAHSFRAGQPFHTAYWITATRRA